MYSNKFEREFCAERQYSVRTEQVLRRNRMRSGTPFRGKQYAGVSAGNAFACLCFHIAAALCEVDYAAVTELDPCFVYLDNIQERMDYKGCIGSQSVLIIPIINLRTELLVVRMRVRRVEHVIEDNAKNPRRLHTFYIIVHCGFGHICKFCKLLLCDIPLTHNISDSFAKNGHTAHSFFSFSDAMKENPDPSMTV